MGSWGIGAECRSNHSLLSKGRVAMLDYQQIVDNVRAAVYDDGGGSAEALAQATADYAAACEEVNRRLARCATFMRRGLRSEAVRQATIEPSLLDAVAALDFPEREDLGQLCRRFRVTAPPPLALETAAELNEAFAAEHPLAGLLRWQRLLALGRSPLKLRLEILRRLMEADPEQPLWREDVLLFEAERLKQIEAEIQQAVAEENVARLAELEDELQDAAWLELPPNRLRNLAVRQRVELGRRHARRWLAGLAEGLIAAFSASDVAEGRSLRRQWLEQAAAAGLQEGDPLREQAAPALAWLAEEDQAEERLARHRQAAASLERGLDRRSPASTLEKLHHQATRDGPALSSALERRYQNRIRLLETATRRRSRLIVVAVGAVSLLLALGIGLLLRQRAEDTAVTEAVAALESFLDDNRLTEAENYLSRLDATNARARRSARVESLAAQLRGAQEEEAKRSAAYHRAVASGQRAIAEREIHAAERAVKQAGELAQGEEEQVLLVELRHDLDRLRQDVQAQRDQALLGALPEIVEQIEELSALDREGLPAAASTVAEVRASLRALEQAHPHASAEARLQLRPLLNRVAALDETLREQQRESLHDRSLAPRVGDAAAFARELTAFVERNPQSPRAAGYRRALEEMASWEAVADWNAFAKRWVAAHREGIDPGRAAKLLGDLNELLVSHAHFPPSETLREWQPHLEAIRRRDGTAAESAVARLKRLVEDPLMSKAWVIEYHTGEPSYLAEPIEPGARPDRLERITRFDGRREPFAVRWSQVAYQGVAAQVPLARMIRKELDTLDADWEAAFAKMIVEVARLRDPDERPRLEPLLQLALLDRVLAAASEGSHPLSRALAPHREHVARAGVDPHLNWLNADDAVRKARAEAAEALAALPDLDAPLARAREEAAAFRKTRLPRFEWIGYVRDGAPRWESLVLRPAGTGSPEGDLYVLRRTAEGLAELVMIGRLREGLAAVDGGAAEALVAGRPVYLEVIERPPS